MKTAIETDQARAKWEELASAVIDYKARVAEGLGHVGSNSWSRLGRALMEYELTGDHDHSTRGNRPIPHGKPCPGGDCLVTQVRTLLLQASLRSLGLV